MKLTLCLLLSLPLFVSAQPSPTWFTWPDGPWTGRFEDVFFVNDSTGWAVGSGGEIFKTTDYARNWESQIDLPQNFGSVEFFDLNVGFVGSLYGKLYKTMNGGEDWYEITDSLPTMPVPFEGICGLSVADDSTIYACGIWSDPAYIFKSTDRGHTWTHIDMSDHAHSLIDIQFTDKDHGFAAGQSATVSDGGIILYTDNGGEDWQVKLLTDYPNDYVWKIQLLDETNAFGSVANFGGVFQTRFLKSTDGGMNWEVKVVDTDFHFVQMGGFINVDTGWTGAYEILETFDGGETWHINNFGYNMNRFFKLHDNLAYASGDSVYIYTDTTYVAPIDTTEDTTIMVSNYHPAHEILTISPNPSAGQIFIQYEIDRFTTIDLNIFDMNGIIIKNIYCGKIQQGVYSTTWEHHLPAGEYVISLHSNEGLRYKKFVVQ